MRGRYRARPLATVSADPAAEPAHALGELVIEGVSENSELHLDILSNPEFVSGNYHTNLMEHLYE